LKALYFGIVRQPLKIKFIKGKLSTLHLKGSAFNAHLVFKVHASSQVESSMFPTKILKRISFKQTGDKIVKQRILTKFNRIYPKNIKNLFILSHYNYQCPADSEN